MQPKGERVAVPIETVVKERGADILIGESFREAHTVVVVPTRGSVPVEVVEAWRALINIPNQCWHWIFLKSYEVGDAYNTAIQTILDNPVLSKWKYVMTLEDDNLPPPDAWPKLLQSLVKYGLDGVSGLYWSKGEDGFPLIIGNPRRFAETGMLDFSIQDPQEISKLGNVVEVNSIPMGCSIFRLDLFRELEKPWFRTAAFFDQKTQTPWFRTQDVWMCEQARHKGKRFAVDMRVKVGHLAEDGRIW